MLINDGGILYDEETAELLKNLKPEDIVFTNERKNIKRKSEKKTEKLICDGGIYYDEETAELLKNLKPEDIVVTPVYLPYSYWRSRQLLREEFGIDMISLHGGYKANRYRDFLSYKLIWIESGETVVNRINLHQIRYFLAGYRFPLHDEKSKKTYQKDGRRQGCVEFLKIVESIGNSVDGK